MSSPTVLDLYEAYGVKVRSKSEWKKWWRMPVGDWWHIVVPMFFWIVGIFNKELKKEFYSDYFTTLYKTVYMPDSDYVQFLATPMAYESILRHELVHVRDMLRDGWLRYSLRYLLRKKWRAYYERRGYAQNMLTRFEKTGAIPDQIRDFVVAKFTGAMYWRMDMNALPKIEDIRSKILSGEYRGLYPNVI